ncbi:DNRLRE domain-containing protein [Nocardiopsis sp. NPDC101807]|uniref:DNRLRE domain-containing protein n=1 Tax=Nocardiopsis sp. NPDC101807 TaxID=3364339 RepID=UPI003821A860
MRRSLPRATTACATLALVLSLLAAAPVAAGDEAPTAGGPGASGEHGAREELIGARGSADPAGGGPGPTGPDADGSPEPARSGGGRTETGSSAWTYVDLAFPDRSYGGAETASVGTGRLAWDRVYTRRALFRFPVAHGPGTAVDSAVLRTRVVWSYDCDSTSFAQVHRVDPFHGGTTWNDQPAARALLDTRSITGGQAACPVDGEVEFDVTEAYRWAVDHGESHLHLRLGERDESGTAAWLRFDVGNVPPALVVDHGTPRFPGKAVGPARPTGDLPRVAADTGPTGDRAAVHDENSPAPAPDRSAGGPDLPGGTVPGVVGSDAARVPGPGAADRLRSGGGRARFRQGERSVRPAAPRSLRPPGGGTSPLARGPPVCPVGDRSPVHRPRRTG